MKKSLGYHVIHIAYLQSMFQINLVCYVKIAVKSISPTKILLYLTIEHKNSELIAGNEIK